jgi:hypothetical protein
MTSRFLVIQALWLTLTEEIQDSRRQQQGLAPERVASSLRKQNIKTKVVLSLMILNKWYYNIQGFSYNLIYICYAGKNLA